MNSNNIDIEKVKNNLRILRIEENDVSKITLKKIRTAYLKNSIKYHPDKNGGKDEEFKKIVNAYEYLTSVYEKIDNINDNEKEKYFKMNSDYNSILEEFLNEISSQQVTWNKEFIWTTIKTVLMKCSGISMDIFEKMDKDKCMEIYEFLLKINDIGFVSDEYLYKLKEIIQKKLKNNNIVILEPNLEDLLNDKVFKLELFSNTFYVPLWHNELYFVYQDEVEKEKKDFIVRIQPILPKNVLIDDDNNIIIYKKINIHEILNTIDDGKLKVRLLDKEFTIKYKNIKITREEQSYLFKNAGLIQINEDNMFESKIRKSIIIKLFLVI